MLLEKVADSFPICPRLVVTTIAPLAEVHGLAAIHCGGCRTCQERDAFNIVGINIRNGFRSTFGVKFSTASTAEVIHRNTVNDV